MEALIIIDVQNGLVNKNLFNKIIFLENINKAIIENTKKNNLIIFVQHNSTTLKTGTKDWEIYSGLIQNNNIIIQKKHGDAFQNTKLNNILLEKNIKEIIICGLVSNGCVFYTCKSGIENGFNVSVIKNGHTNWLKDAENKIIEINNKLENIGVKVIENQ